jgi:hypothetical protein
MERRIPPNHPNRWNTRVTVEVIRSSGQRSYMEFRDAQLAYMWIEDFTRNLQDNYTCKSFEEMCSELDTEYLQSGLLGFVPVAQNTTTQLTIFYGVVRLT